MIGGNPMDRQCDFCGCLFKDGEIVQATVLAHYKVLKSARCFAIDKPFDCVGMRHKDCYTNSSEGD